MASETHLQMIQNVISRLAGQSTTIKGWCVTVTAALLGFGTTSTTPAIAAIAIYVVCAFAVLDAYYLTLERAYRTLYQQTTTDQADAWTMQITRPTITQVGTALRSPVILLLYGSSLLAAASVGLYLLLR